MMGPYGRTNDHIWGSGLDLKRMRVTTNIFTLRRFIAAVLCLMLVLPPAKIGAAEQSDANVQALAEVYQLLKDYHVSGIESDALTDAAIKGMIESLQDPFTEYYSPEELNDLVDSIEQHFVGIGIRIGEDGDRYY